MLQTISDQRTKLTFWASELNWGRTPTDVLLLVHLCSPVCTVNTDIVGAFAACWSTYTSLIWPDFSVLFVTLRPNHRDNVKSSCLFALAWGKLVKQASLHLCKSHFPLGGRCRFKAPKEACRHVETVTVCVSCLTNDCRCFRLCDIVAGQDTLAPKWLTFCEWSGHTERRDSDCALVASFWGCCVFYAWRTALLHEVTEQFAHSRAPAQWIDQLLTSEELLGCTCFASHFKVSNSGITGEAARAWCTQLQEVPANWSRSDAQVRLWG